MPGSSFASERVRERRSGEAKEIRIDCKLFADDTIVEGTKGEMDGSVRCEISHGQVGGEEQ